MERMIGYGLKTASTLQITVKDSNFNFTTRQTKLNPPCRDAMEFTRKSMELFKSNFKGGFKVRLLGVSVTNFDADDLQFSLFEEEAKKTVDEKVFAIRSKYGHGAIKRANALLDERIANTFSEE